MVEKERHGDETRNMQRDRERLTMSVCDKRMRKKGAQKETGCCIVLENVKVGETQSLC